MMCASPMLEFIIAGTVSLLLACGAHTAAEGSAAETASAASSESSGAPASTVALLRGGVEKGPLLLGSSITASRLDATGSPTGLQYASQIADDSGAFSIGEVPLGIYLLEGVGHHFDEVSGELSRAPITLRAVVELDGGGEPVFVNVLSHLAHRRVLALLTDGVEVSAALAQADAEVLAALPIGAPGLAQEPASATGLSLLGGDSLGARLLLAASAEFIAAGRSIAADDAQVDAQLQQLLNRAAEVLADGGGLDDVLTAQLESGLLALDPAGIDTNLGARLVELGLDAEPPDLDLVLDQDRDGIMNPSDDCPTAVDPEQVDSDADGLGEPCDTLPFGPAEIVLDGLVVPLAFAVRPDWVYLFESGLTYRGGELLRVALSDGEIEVLRRNFSFNLHAVVTDTALFWIEDTKVLTAALDGSAVEVFAPSAEGPLAADATHLYFAAAGIQRQPLSGGASEVLVANVYWITDIALGGGGVLWSDDNEVRFVGGADQELRRLAQGLQQLPMLAADDAAAYWLEQPSCTLRRVGLADAATSVLWTPTDPQLECQMRVRPALVGEFIYWVTDTAIYRARRDDGSELRLVAQNGPESPVHQPSALQVDATHVWWINPYVGDQPSASGQLVRTRIP